MQRDFDCFRDWAVSRARFGWKWTRWYATRELGLTMTSGWALTHRGAVRRAKR